LLLVSPPKLVPPKPVANVSALAGAADTSAASAAVTIKLLTRMTRILP
jgi:hypothetical protein